MMEFRYDIHVHCSENSTCSPCPGAQIAAGYADAGYTGFVMTNHFLAGYGPAYSPEDWERECRGFMTGWQNAKEVGDARGIDVFFGWEYNYRGADLLTYGLGLDFLLAHPDMTTWHANRYFDEVHAAGGYIIHAHPFRQTGYIESIQLFPDKTDAVEVYNGSHYAPVYSPAFNDRALWYAQTFHKVQTAGSDTHGLSFGLPHRGGSMLFPRRPASVQEMIDLIRNNRFRIEV